MRPLAGTTVSVTNVSLAPLVGSTLLASVDDRSLIVQTRSGSQEAFSELYTRYLPAVWRFCLARTGSEVAAQDLTSEVFLKALAHIDRYDERGVPFLAYLYRIARNGAIDTSRRKRDVTSYEELLVEPAGKSDTEAAASDRYVRDQLLAALASLDDAHRQVLLLRFVEGLEAEEVAALVGKSTSSVRSLQHRALGKLRKELERKGLSANVLLACLLL